MAPAAETTPVASPNDAGDDLQDIMFAKRGCCYWMSSGSIWWERITNAPPEKEENWWAKRLNGLRKIREWTELVAGPRWKTFIRRFTRNWNGNNGKNSLKFQYDPMSYSLNFDEGPGQNGHFDDDRSFRHFSSRYASIPVSGKSSMDLGIDGPSFD